MATQNVSVMRTGTGWTVDVTPCDLDPDLSIKDFFVLHNGTPYAPYLLDYAKTTATVLTYTGAALPSTTIEVRRKTPTSVVQSVSYASRISSSLWNKEFDRVQRRAEEYELNGVGAAFSGVIPAPINDPFGAGWDADITYPPTRNAVYDKMITMAPLASPALTGTPTAPTAAKATNSTQIATTAFVKTVVADYAPLSSPSLTGTPTAPTPGAGTNNTQIATTAFVKSWVTPTTASNGHVDIGNIRMMWGSNVVTCNASGDATVTYPVPFASDPASTILVSNGDTGVGKTLIISLYTLSDTTGFSLRVSTPGGVGHVGVFRLNWFVIGRAV